MCVALPANLPRVTRPRPTDATGCFWAFISLVVGLIFGAIFPPLAFVLIAFPFCILWQFKKWRTDSEIVTAATNWCGQHYPNAGGTPIVDFVIALVHSAGADLQDCSPETPIDVLNWMSDDDQAAYWYPEPRDRTLAWLRDVLAEARINDIDLSAFSGTTLRDAINLILAAHDFGEPTVATEDES